MINTLNIITFVGTLLGIIILISSLLKLVKAQTKLNKVSDEEYFTEFKKLGIRRYLILCIIGLSIFSIMGLARIFLR